MNVFTEEEIKEMGAFTLIKYQKILNEDCRKEALGMLENGQCSFKEYNATVKRIDNAIKQIDILLEKRWNVTFYHKTSKPLNPEYYKED